MEQSTGIEFWVGNPSTEVKEGILTLANGETRIVCLLDIPTSILLPDLAGFLLPALGMVAQIKILRSESSKYYLCCILMNDAYGANALAEEFAEKPFNSIEENSAHLQKVGAAVFKDQTGLFAEKPDNCPICLEEIEGPCIFILCGHNFHLLCLEKVGELSCPVCRYHITPPDKSQCDTCGEDTGISMCLICGELRCKDHSQEHLVSKGHNYFQEIETRTTWDYSRGLPVHRLVQSEGKLVEVPDMEHTKKVETLMFEYNCLLASLLETQREYYEKLSSEIDIDDGLEQKLNSVLSENRELKRKLDSSTGIDEELRELYMEVDKETSKKQRLRTEHEKLTQLQKNRPAFKLTKEVKQEIDDLKSQIHDLGFHLQSQKKLKDEETKSITIIERKH